MLENVEAFFTAYHSDAALRERVSQAEESYPGSLELRESLVEAVLLPIAEELGLPFTVAELRSYETRKKLHSLPPDVPIQEGEEIDDDFEGYWLLDRGWQNDPDIFKQPGRGE